MPFKDLDLKVEAFLPLNVMVFNFLHPLKHCLSNVFTLPFTVRDVMPLQPLNACFPILVTFFPIVTFVIFVNDKELMHFSYLRYLENQLRQNFGFEGTPLVLKVIGRQEKEEAKEAEKRGR